MSGGIVAVVGMERIRSILCTSYRGSCPCSINQSCEDPNQSCNCDSKESKWFTDDGYYESVSSLGITDMYFLQQPDLDEEAKGRITLGPLECVETSEYFEFNANKSNV